MPSIEEVNRFIVNVVSGRGEKIGERIIDEFGGVESI